MSMKLLILIILIVPISIMLSGVVNMIANAYGGKDLWKYFYGLLLCLYIIGSGAMFVVFIYNAIMEYING